MSRNSSGTRPESLEVVDADSDRNSQYASHAARPTSVQYVRGGVPPESVASGDAKDAGVVLETGGERGEVTQAPYVIYEFKTQYKEHFYIVIYEFKTQSISILKSQSP
eukprot:COSAG06_NODE_3782_length_4911_cov_2.138612_3_plen_108_part_00